MIKIENDIVTFKNEQGKEVSVGIGTPEAFRILSKLWLRSGWDTKYVYSFSWMGRPIIQLPEDMMRIQEIIYSKKPDVVIETGIAHGGSLIFYSSIFKAMNKGRVIGVDIEIRPHNKKAIEEHELSDRITMVQGSSVDADTVQKVRNLVKKDETALVLLDSNHSYEHVLKELHAYAEFVSVGSYIVACDGIMKDVVGAPRTESDWGTNNPQTAVHEFLKERKDFVLEEPIFPFNEGVIKDRVTYWPNAYLRRVK